VGVHVLRRQIVKIGNVFGPFELDQLKTLHPEDLNILQFEADKLDAALATEITAEATQQRGRSDQPGESH